MYVKHLVLLIRSNIAGVCVGEACNHHNGIFGETIVYQHLTRGSRVIMGRRQLEASCNIHCTSLKIQCFGNHFHYCAMQRRRRRSSRNFSFSRYMHTNKAFPAFGRSLWLLQKKPSALQMKSSSNLLSCSKAVPHVHIRNNMMSVNMKMHTVTELVGAFITSGNRVIHMSTQTNLRSLQFPSTFYLTSS